jgi:spore maturation protein CgeB
MRIHFFCHSVISDWNNGRAHFLRGVATELAERGHEVVVFEPADSWSLQNLIEERGNSVISDFHQAFPKLVVRRYEMIDLECALDGADLVIVHEWNPPKLIHAIGELRAKGWSFRLLFHDTHHRSVSDERAIARCDLTHYDGVLAFGSVLRDLYRQHGWAENVWTWHEAADVRVFKPHPEIKRDLDLVWIGNWGDGERSAELVEFLFEPIAALRLRAEIFGVRFSAVALAKMLEAGITFSGWLPNYKAPEAFARARVTVHVPRQPYVRHLPGIPTIRPFEAMACGIPLVSAPWDDCEFLFREGRDYLTAKDGAQMTAQLRAVLDDKELAAELSRNGLETIRRRHTCAHRADELLHIVKSVGLPTPVSIASKPG